MPSTLFSQQAAPKVNKLKPPLLPRSPLFLFYTLPYISLSLQFTLILAPFHILSVTIFKSCDPLHLKIQGGTFMLENE